MTVARTRIRRPPPVSETLQQLGERIRQARTEAGLSQAQLGAPHFTRAYVSAIELGKVQPAMKSLEFLADKLGKPVSSFIENADTDRVRRERELEVSAALALLSRQTAAEALARAEILIETSVSHVERRKLHLLAGTALNLLARGSDALRHLAAAERTSATDPALARSVKYQMAIAFRLTDNVQRAEDLLRQVLADIEANAAPDQPLRMKVLKDLGVVAMDRGDYAAANGYFVTAMEWAKDIGDVAGLISIYNGLAYSHRALGDLDSAASYLQRALGATEVVHDLTSAVIMHNGLAVIAAERGHVQSAFRHADQAIQLARASGPAAYVPHCLNTKAECAAKVGDWEMAETIASEALEAARVVSNERAAAAARLVLGRVRLNRSDMAGAERELQEAAAIYLAIGAKAELGETYMRISEVASEQGKLSESRRFASLAYEATRKSTALVGD